MKTIYGNVSASAALDRRPGSRPGIGRALTMLATRAVEILFVWHERESQRRALESLGDHALRDIGLSRADAAREADKPFWRA